MTNLQFWQFLHWLITTPDHCEVIQSAPWVHAGHQVVVYGGSCVQSWALAAQSAGRWIWTVSA